uniref:Uncharacterized protein n=1 Tax=Acrobeloides nanus TaxID=290746 RepID=A0A914CZM9_9BILA
MSAVLRNVRLVDFLVYMRRRPDLNPLDYSVWSILEGKAYAKPHQTVESLKRARSVSTEISWNEISVDTLRGIVDNFSKKLKKCIDGNGGHFE